MRYEFERDGTVVASVLWEGPGQVTVETAEPTTRSVVDRYLSSEVVYLGSGFDFGEDQEQDVLQMRRRDWTPWEFERACRNLAHRLQAHVRRVETGPVEASGGGDTMKMSGAEALLKALEDEGVEDIFGIPGGAIMPIYDPLVDRRSATCCAATNRAPATPPRATPGRPARSASCMATSGPGATNLVTPLADAKMDSVPIVAITGQVPTPVVGNDAFQEADITGITMPITKHNFLVKDPADIVADRARGVPHRLDRPARPGADRPAEGRAASPPPPTSWPDSITLPGYKPTTRATTAR